MQQQVLLLLGGDLAGENPIHSSLGMMVSLMMASLMIASLLAGNFLMDALLCDICEQLLVVCLQQLLTLQVCL